MRQYAALLRIFCNLSALLDYIRIMNLIQTIDKIFRIMKTFARVLYLQVYLLTVLLLYQEVNSIFSCCCRAMFATK